MTYTSVCSGIETALLANNGGGTIDFKKELCRCDESVGFCPCEYCAVHSALTRCLKFFKQQEAK